MATGIGDDTLAAILVLAGITGAVLVGGGAVAAFEGVAVGIGGAGGAAGLVGAGAGAVTVLVEVGAPVLVGTGTEVGVLAGA